MNRQAALKCKTQIRLICDGGDRTGVSQNAGGKKKTLIVR